jgi:hypothetical protein
LGWLRALGIARQTREAGEKNVGQRADEPSLRRQGRRRAAWLTAAIARRYVDPTRVAGAILFGGTGGEKTP